MKRKTEALTIKHIKNSSFYGFWLRLKKLNWKLETYSYIEYKQPKSDYVYLKIWWAFTKGKKKLIFFITRNNYRLIVKHNGELVVKTRKVPTPNWLEMPFLDYLKETKPLQIPRLGKQTPVVEKWLLKQRRLQQQREKELKQKKKSKNQLANTK